MVQCKYKDAWNLLTSVSLPSSDMLFLKATCALKLKKYHVAIQVLNEIKRNQVCRKLKIKAMLMRMKVYRKLQLYDESL